MQRTHRGFTLIELMIVVAIIGILAAVALPSYRGYVAKSRLSEVLLALSKCRTAVSEVYLTARAAPGANAWGCDEGNTSSRYVDTLATSGDGAIVVTVRGFDDPGIDGKTIELIPTDTNGTPLRSPANLGERVSRWRCQAGASNGLPTRVLPMECR